MRLIVFLFVAFASVAFAQDWRALNPATGEVPADALKSGRESDGRSIYIIRCSHDGSLCVGKYVPQNRRAYISYGGKEIEVVTPVEIFCGFGLWEFTTSNEMIPADPVVGGTESDGSPLYIIRAVFKGGTQVGKYSAKYRNAYFPYGGKEYEVSGNFSILVNDRTPEASLKKGEVMGGGIAGAMAGAMESGKSFAYSLEINYDGYGAMKNTGTNNQITVTAVSKDGSVLFTEAYTTFKTPKRLFTITFTAPKHVAAIRLSTDGDDGFRIAQMLLFKDKIEVGKWGDQGPQGFCLSTDPNDAKAEWTGTITSNGCKRCLEFQVGGNTVVDCPGGY